MATKKNSGQRGRSAINGQFTTVEEAKQHPRTHIVESIKRTPPPKKKKSS